MILSDKTIWSLLLSGDLSISPLDDLQIQPASVDVRLGKSFLVYLYRTWPATATSIGVRIEKDKLKVYAPFGLNDLFGMIVKANKTQISEKIYMMKVQKWIDKWPSLTIIPW